MPSEKLLVGPVQVRRLPNGDRDVLCVHGQDAATAIRIPAAAIGELCEGLAMDETEMQHAQARQQAASRLVVPSGPINGNGRH